MHSSTDLSLARSLRLPFIAAALLVTHAATAANITAYSRATFQAALSGGVVSSQTFDGFASGTILGTVDGVTFSASLGDPLVTGGFVTTTFPQSLGSTSVGFFSANETATFSFATAITAFAIDINTFATAPGSYSALLDIGNVALSAFDVFPGFTTGQFIGFISDTPFSSVTISASTGFAYSLDTLIYGEAARIVNPDPVPDAGSLAVMLLGGMLPLGAAARRIRRA